MLFNRIIFAADHAGFSLKEMLVDYASQKNIPYEDVGVFSADACDYPDLIPSVVDAVDQGAGGVLICGSGIGMSIAANRYPHIRAALCPEGLSARLSRQHNNANILVLGSRLIGPQMALECLNHFLLTPFEGGRHAQRLEKVEKLPLDKAQHRKSTR